MNRVLAWCLALTALVPGSASAQSFFAGDGCDSLARCETGGVCGDPGTRAAMIGGACFCIPADAGSGELPTQCCTDTGACGPGGSCAFFSDTSGGLCLRADVDYCGAGPTSVAASDARACHTAPDGTSVLLWARGDCDGDGVTNGVERDDPLRDPCTHDDFGACEDAGMPAAVCCTLSPEPFACCSDSEDPVACCSGNALYSECCLAAEADGRVSLLECCVGSPSAPALDCCSFTDGLTGTACCEALGGPDDLCCEVGILSADACMPDAGAPIDTDAGVTTPTDAGAPMDTGARVDGVSFGGGGGCVCGVGHARPSLLAVLLGLAIAIPGARRRRA